MTGSRQPRLTEELLSAYLDDEVTAEERALVEAAIAADPVTRDWWALCGPMQRPLDTRAPNEWWAGLTEVFHSD